MMEHALRKWDDKDEADKTWANCKEHFIKAYADRHKHGDIEAKQHFSSANQAEELESEYANATSELIQSMVGPILQQLATQSQQNTELLQALKESQSNKGSGGGNGGGTKKKCAHCGKPRHKGGDAKCWELEENKETRPTNWKSVKA